MDTINQAIGFTYKNSTLRWIGGSQYQGICSRAYDLIPRAFLKKTKEEHIQQHKGITFILTALILLEKANMTRN